MTKREEDIEKQNQRMQSIDQWPNIKVGKYKKKTEDHKWSDKSKQNDERSSDDL